MTTVSQSESSPVTIELRVSGNVRRWLMVIYLGSAVFLAPWIVLLFLNQSKHAEAHHLRFLLAGISVFYCLGILATASTYRRRSSLVVLVGSLTAALSLLLPWFIMLGATQVPVISRLVEIAVFHVPVLVLAGLAVRSWFVPDQRTRHPLVFLPPALTVMGLVVLPAVTVITLAVAPAHVEAGQLRMVWTGLDVFELISLVTTAYFLRHNRAALAVASSVAAALFFCDGWFNIMGTTGRVAAAAIVMALAEWPLSALSLWIAHRLLTQQGDGDPRRA
jgi:hypothetical protein